MAQTTYPLVARDVLGLHNSTIGTIAAISGVTGILVSALLVPKIAHSAMLWFLVLGETLWLASFVLFGLLNSSIDIWIGAITLGTGTGFVLPILMTVIGMGKGEDRAKALALFALALSASLVLGPLLEAGVLHILHNSLQTTFIAFLPLSAAATASAVITALRVQLHITNSDNTNSQITISKKVSQPPTVSPSKSFQQSSFWIAFHTMLMYQAPFTALVVFGGLLARYDDHASVTEVELAFAIFFVISLLVRALIILWSPIARKAGLLIASAAITIVGIGILGTVPGIFSLFLAMAILGAPHGANFPLAMAVLAEHTPKHRLGTANGLLMAGDNVAVVIVPFVCGWLIETVGYRSMFLILELPVIAFASFLVFQLLRTPLVPAPVATSITDELPPDRD